MKKALRFLCAVVTIWICSTGVAMAASPLPDNGSFNALTQTMILDYKTAPYTHAVVTGFPDDGYAEVWINSAYKKVMTPTYANALLMAPRTSNATVRVRVPHKDIDVSGNVLVRHGLYLSPVAMTNTRCVANGAVLPKGSGSNSVQVVLQRKVFGIWITAQKQTVKSSNEGKFSSVFTSGNYNGTYRVRVYVPSDKTNYACTAYRDR